MNERDACFALIRSELNEFLFAPIGPEHNGMTLSVVSGLARLGVDPWEEAARLANLPVPDATDKLARTIALISGGGWRRGDAEQIAARLIRLLPKHGRAVAPEAAEPSPPRTTQRRIAVALVWLLLGALAVGMIVNHGASLFGGDRDEAPIAADPRA
jgi:hypothetical protein